MPNIHIEGNIGTGKTTLLQNLAADGYEISQEPVEKWQESGILDLYYQDPTRWAFLFQINSMVTRMREVEKINNNITFVERSIHSDKLFAKLCLENNNLTAKEHEVYLSLQDWTRENIKYKIDAIIYLRASPEISMERIKKRSRNEESNIPFEYIKQLHNKHDEWLLCNKEIPTLVLDFDDFVYARDKQQIMSFIASL